MSRNRRVVIGIGLVLAAASRVPPVRTAAPDASAVDPPVIWSLDNLDRIGGHPVIRIGTPTVVATPIGSAIEFDGASDGLLLDTNPIEGFARFTVEVLFEPSPAGPEEQRFLHLSEHGSERRAMLETRLLPDRTWALDTYLRGEPPGLALLDRRRAHASGTWHTAALVYDGRTMTSCVDGIRELSGDVAFGPLGPGRLSIGVRQNRVSWFAGRIRLIRISPSALSVEQLLVPPQDTLPGMPAGR